MPSAKALLFGVLAAMGVAFVAIWARQPRAPGTRARPGAKQIGIGFVTNFFDTLGIGSFATTTSLFKLGHAVADENIPGTLNVGHMIPTFAEAFIFIAIVEVDMTTLALMVAAATLGAWLGAGVLSPAASVRFVRSGRYDLPALLGLTIGGTPAVIIAAYWIKSLPLAAVKWLVVAVVVYTAVAMLRSARMSRV